ncbi:MAG: hypothetical protein PGN37_11300 [Mycobacterium kyogaense]|uniref:hypothetical protein n=1 Tax=Mycobacterium kyogaense TaxID=2212479 RepID=UPI002FF47072
MDESMPIEKPDVSEALTIYLRRYPGSNLEEFSTRYGPSQSTVMKSRVHAMLDEAVRIELDWTEMSLNEAADYVEAEMLRRHPELSTDSLEAIGNYYTYLMR